MKITDDLIAKFLENRCSPEEADLVLAYLSQHPDEAGIHLNTHDWEQTDGEGELPDALRRKMLDVIRTEAYGKEKRAIPLIRWAAAAAVIIILAGGWWVRTVLKKQPAAIVASSKVQEEPNANAKIWHNTTRKAMAFRLPDGSSLLLAAGSTLRSDTAFGKHKRDLFLDGEAFFEVAKNESAPFTVYAGDLATTALGTSFRVIANHGGTEKIAVRLFTGKVVVRAAGRIPQNWKGDVVLAPGEQLQYETAGGTIALTRFREEDGKGGTAQEPGGDMVFDNAPFKDVMDKLIRKYGIAIHYDRAKTEDIYFSGTISASDSLPVVLKMIARMNNLEALPEGSGYLIRKPRE